MMTARPLTLIVGGIQMATAKWQQANSAKTSVKVRKRLKTSEDRRESAKTIGVLFVALVFFAISQKAVAI